MKKLVLILAVAAFAASPLFVTEAQAGQGKGRAQKIQKIHKLTHKLHHLKHQLAKHHGKHHKV